MERSKLIKSIKYVKRGLYEIPLLYINGKAVCEVDSIEVKVVNHGEIQLTLFTSSEDLEEIEI